MTNKQQSKKRLKLRNKTYEIILGAIDKDGEYYNVNSIIVKATEVWSALAVAGDWILKEEKTNKKNGEETFVESVRYIDTIIYE